MTPKQRNERWDHDEQWLEPHRYHVTAIHNMGITFAQERALKDTAKRQFWTAIKYSWLFFWPVSWESFLAEDIFKITVCYTGEIHELFPLLHGSNN